MLWIPAYAGMTGVGHAGVQFRVGQRLLAGIQSVAPALAALNIVAGTYGRNVAIATGAWAASIDRKLVELRRAKKNC